MSAQSKTVRRSRRKRHIRKQITGTAQRPRISVFRSLKHIYAQAVDDSTGRTLAAASSLNDELVTSLTAAEAGGKVSLSVAVGKALASRLKEQNVENAVFDRNGYLYHGRIQSVAEGVREGGLTL